MFRDVYRGRTVLLTGHTGFKGAWLSLWLTQLGARVVGYALPPATTPNLFDAAGIAGKIEHNIGDVRDGEALEALVRRHNPDIVFHLAAQPLVLESYLEPRETFAINVMGSINLMEALRRTKSTAAVVMVTTDKVYLNREWPYAYREGDALGGHDPYSASKAAMEIAVASWRDSFFEEGVKMASARAGNVIGGGDWSANRIIPDLARALQAGLPAEVRNPNSVRPWQHVLEPLAGYLHLGALLHEADGTRWAGAWNFGPAASDVRTVADLADRLVKVWGAAPWINTGRNDAPHEAGLLKLGIDKAVGELGWRPVWNFDSVVERTGSWYRTVLSDPSTALAATVADLETYVGDARALGLTWAK